MPPTVSTTIAEYSVVFTAAGTDAAKLQAFLERAFAADVPVDAHYPALGAMGSRTPMLTLDELLTLPAAELRDLLADYEAQARIWSGRASAVRLVLETTAPTTPAPPPDESTAHHAAGMKGAA